MWYILRSWLWHWLMWHQLRDKLCTPVRNFLDWILDVGRHILDVDDSFQRQHNTKVSRGKLCILHYHLPAFLASLSILLLWLLHSFIEMKTQTVEYFNMNSNPSVPSSPPAFITTLGLLKHIAVTGVSSSPV